MRRIASLVIGFVVATAVAAALARKPVTLEQLKVQAAADAATPEGQAYLKQFFTNQLMLAFEDASEHCRSAQLASSPKDRYVIALNVGVDGFPLEVLVSPDDQGMRCEADRLKAYQFIKPPHDAFAIYMPYEAVEPGSEREREIRAAAEAAK